MGCRSCGTGRLRYESSGGGRWAKITLRGPWTHERVGWGSWSGERFDC